MESLRILLQLSFLCDPFLHLQADTNKKLGLGRYFYACSHDPQTCVGFGTVLRWASNLLFACAAFAMWGIMFTGDNIPTITEGESGAGRKDFTQLPVKIATVLFTVEVMTTMLLFPRAAASFSCRHISRDTVKSMTNGILAVGVCLFWLTYLIVFFSIIFLKDLPNSRDFVNQMYGMHKIWIGAYWITQPAFLVFYCTGMLIGFAVYIVSVSRFAPT